MIESKDIRIQTWVDMYLITEGDFNTGKEDEWGVDVNVRLLLPNAVGDAPVIGYTFNNIRDPYTANELKEQALINADSLARFIIDKVIDGTKTGNTVSTGDDKTTDG